ncbi:DNA cytosine methyltransferase [Streptomyces sp. NBC_01725]|uniref:DNA cytosine methyltransferase n=1 Tax=Streptomyces sp. NBC_01725 TaxID=2975923 RepID=UPI002E282D1F|nr:DNA cytosine methyltransferase [Streptomyces sp. NBC_01725]
MRSVEIVDLFAGPGGLDVAARNLGVPASGIEWDPDACKTRIAAGLDTTKGDVRDFGPKDFPDASVLAGGPPCQTFTVAGSGVGRRALDTVIHFVHEMAAGNNIQADLSLLDDERTGLVLEPLRWALAAQRNEQPYDVIVLEQVPSVLPVWKEIGKVLEPLGYSVKTKVLRTEEFGVPQTRRRAILVARRNGEAALPAPTHRPYRKGVSREDGDPALSKWRRMCDVLDRPEEFVVVSNYGSGGDPKARGRRLSTEPAATVTGKISRNRVLTSDGSRELPRFSHAEAGLLQTFPALYPWSGQDLSQQIGNAIPPRLAEHVLTAALGLEKPSSSEAEVGMPGFALTR